MPDAATPPPSAVIEITSQEQLDQVLKAAPGPIVADFVMEGCTPCDASKPQMDALASTCKSDTTFLRIDVNKMSELADKLEVAGTPTTMYAKTGADLVAGKASEVDDPFSEAFKRRIKCARTPK